MSTDPGEQAPPVRGGQWTYAEVAAHLGIARGAVRAYASSGRMPAPDGRLGRTSWWWESTIRAWAAARPGQGARTDLHEQAEPQ